MPLPAKHPAFLNWLGLLLLAAALAGCGRDNVKVYRLSNDDSASASSQPNPAAAVPDQNQNTPAQPQLSWTLPSGWTEVAPGQMSIATFKVSGANGVEAEVSVVPLPGGAGGDNANVNRWRGQVGLAPATADELQKMAESVQVGDQTGTLYDIAGGDNARRILGMIQERNGTTWFFKMMGDANLVEQQKPEFVAFLKSLTFTAASAQTEELPPGHPPVGGGTMNAPMMSSGAASPAKPDWTVPAGWQEVPAAQFLLAEYDIAGTNGAKAEVNVAQLAGSGGGVLANVNRWRGQIGLDPVDEAGLAKLANPVNVTGGQATFVDISGNDMSGESIRLVAAIVPRGDQTWFFKLMGNAQVVAGQKDAFTKFVQTTGFTNAP